MYNPEVSLADGEDHRTFLRKTYDIAWLFSEDRSTKTGAAIVGLRKDNRTILGTGWNHFSEEKKALIRQDPTLLDDSIWKRDNITHAEIAALKDLIAYGISSEGLDMYMPWLPCSGCAQEIAGAGISRLYGHKEMIIRTPDDWTDDLEEGRKILKDGGVTLYMIPGSLGGVKGCFRRQEWEP